MREEAGGLYQYTKGRQRFK